MVLQEGITGQKKPTQIFNDLGIVWIITWVCEIKTAHEEANKQLSVVTGAVPLQLYADNHEVMTFFWADNFYLNLETPSGHGAIN